MSVALVSRHNREGAVALSLNNKAHRVLMLLSGLRNQKVLGLAKSRGFSQVDLDEGWKLFRTAIDVQVDRVAEPTAVDPTLVDRLDAWENRWYQTISATLERHHPALHAKVFANLPRTGGLELFATVPVLLRRLKELESGALGPHGKEARDLLTRRGLVPAVISEATKLLEQSGMPEPTMQQPAPFDPAAAQAAEDAMWAWYREWSQILRVEITDGRVLRELGLTRTVQRTVVEEIDDELGADAPAAPAPAATAGASAVDTSKARADLRGGSPFTQ